MATFSTVALNKNNSDTVPVPSNSNGTLTQKSITLDAPKPSLRGMNKPKCIKCGNIARSRCDFQSCKGCCAKAQNPCLIHVLKQSSSTLPDKPPPSASPLPEQLPSDPPSKGSSTRLSSLRQLSSTYVNSLRAKRPLSRKDAISINQWRFKRLREYIEGNAEAEDEAFDRYTWNISLLEEAFSLDGEADHTSQPSTEDVHKRLVSSIKAKLQGGNLAVQIHRERIQSIVNVGLEKLHKWNLNRDPIAKMGLVGLGSSRELGGKNKLLALHAERTAFGGLIDKLTKARTDDDLKPLLELKRKLFKEEPDAIGQAAEAGCGKLLESQDGLNHLEALLAYSIPKPCTATKIEQDGLSDPEQKFSSLDQIIQL